MTTANVTAEVIPLAPRLERTEEQGVVYRKISLTLRSRIVLFLMRLFLKPIVTFVFRSGRNRMARFQMQVASLRCPDTSGMSIEYRLVGKEPGHVIGNLGDPARPVVLWLHGGGFVLPAAPTQHHVMIAKLCRDLGADGFMPDYRLAPMYPFPAGLDDCMRAYLALLELGFSPKRIVLGGDSAGANLALGLLQRIRKAGVPMPACAIPISPVTEMCRPHGLPSRYRVGRRDPLLSIAAMPHLREAYIGDADARNPELSPLYMDCGGLPPMFFMASSNEILLDDTVMLARRMSEAGVPTRCHIWPHFPHAFPLFERAFPEVVKARQEIVEFARQHTG